MLLDDEREEELREMVERLERLVPPDGAHLTIAGGPDTGPTVGNRAGYLRLGIAFLEAALRPLPESEGQPPRVVPQLDGLLTPGSASPFELCELDESIGSRPPVRTRLGALGEIGAGVLVVAAIVLLFIGASVVWHWVFR